MTLLEHGKDAGAFAVRNVLVVLGMHSVCFMGEDTLYHVLD